MEIIPVLSENIKLPSEGAFYVVWHQVDVEPQGRPFGSFYLIFFDKISVFERKLIDKYLYSKYNVIELIEHSSHKLITAGSASFFHQFHSLQNSL